jgi:hypothetical protein
MEQENEIKNKLTELFKRVLFHKDTFLIGHRYAWDGHSPIKEEDIKKTASFRTVIQRTSEYHGWNYEMEVKEAREQRDFRNPAYMDVYNDGHRRDLGSHYFIRNGYDLSEYPELKGYYGNAYRDYCDAYSSDEKYCEEHGLELNFYNKTETFNEIIIHFKEGEPPLKIKDGLKSTFYEEQDIELSRRHLFFFKKKKKFTIYRRKYSTVYYIKMGDNMAYLTQEEYLEFFKAFRDEFYKPIIKKAKDDAELEKVNIVDRRLKDYE